MTDFLSDKLDLKMHFFKHFQSTLSTFMYYLDKEILGSSCQQTVSKLSKESFELHTYSFKNKIEGTPILKLAMVK